MGSDIGSHNNGRPQSSSSFQNKSSFTPLQNLSQPQVSRTSVSAEVVSDSDSNMDKKMFSTYPKLPPIRKASNGVDSRRISFTSKEVSETKILALFDLYKDPTEDAILADGVEKFCQDLNVRPEEFKVLVLAWKYGAGTMCKFTRSEFVNGCKSLKADSVKGIQSKFVDMLKEVKNPEQFKDFYKWTYKFGLDSEQGQRTLPTDIAVSLWRLVYTQNEPSILKRWLDFLEVHTGIKGIPKDTWDMFLNFAETVGDDLGFYDDNEAWPSLFDDFVEYENDRQNQNVTDNELRPKNYWE